MSHVSKVMLFLFLTSFAIPKKKQTTVWLIGDSTIAIKEPKAYPETGWGMPFAHFFDSTVLIENRAKNGRSTKSFRAEGLWQSVMDNLSPGDYVFIQFGHNDEGKEKVGRYTTPDEFKANLIQYVTETQHKQALPILITPVARRTFDSTGVIKESHPIYADVVKEVSRLTKTPLIDLNEKSKVLLQQYGAENAKHLYNHLQPEEHPNYPSGKNDDTHFNELGARKMAQLVLNEIKSLNLDIATHIKKPYVKP